MLVLVFAGALVAIVASGPIELGAVRDRIETTLAARLGPDYGVKVARSTVDVDPVLGLVLEIDEITVRDSDNSVVGRIPAARLAIDPLSLLRLRIDIRTIEVSDAEVLLVRDKAGRVFLGNDATPHPMIKDDVAREAKTAQTGAAASAGVAARLPVPGPSGGFPDLFSALQTLDAAIEPSIDLALERGFERLSIDGANIQIWDAGRLQKRSFPHSDLAVTIDPATKDVQANFNTSGYAGRWGIIAERSVDEKLQSHTLSLVFSQLTLPDLNPDFGRPESLLTSDIPVFGRATVRLGDDGAVQDAAVRVDLGAGTVVSGFGKDTILLDEATIRLHWDLAKRSLVVEPSSFYFGDTKSVIVGEIKPASEKDDGRYSFSFESPGTVLASREAHADPIMVDRLALAGTLDIPGQRLDFTDAAISTPVGSVSAAGTLGLDGPTPSLALSAAFTPMPVSTLKQMWPPILAGPARKWVFDHITEGQLDAGSFDAAIPGGVLWTGERVTLPENYMRLDMRLSGVSFTTIGNLPPITNASGQAVLAGSTFGVDLDGGQATSPSGKTVKLTAGAFAVANTSDRTPDSHIELQLEGDVGAMAEIADSDPIRAMKRQSIDPATLSGTGNANLSIKVPLRGGLTPADIDWRVALKASNFASSKPIEGKSFRNGTLNMDATPSEVTIKGKAEINGVTASIDLLQPLKDTDGDGDIAEGHREVRLSLDEKARKQLGIGLDNVLAGTIGASVSDLGPGEGQHYELDMKQARLTLQAVGWSKGIGVPAKLEFDLKQTSEGYSVENMVATGDGFGFKGSAVLDRKYGLISANIDHLALRKGDQISVQLARKGNGYSIVARGSSFDVRGLIAQYKSSTPGPSEDAADIYVDAKVDSLIGFNKQLLSSASINVQSHSGMVMKAGLEGVFDRGGVSMDFRDTGNAAELQLTSADAGGLARFIDLYSKIGGGKLSLTGQRAGPTGPFQGVFDVVNFTLVGEPSMHRLMSATNGTGAHATASGLNPDNVPFGRMRLDYTKRGPVIVIDDAVLRGANVGATFNGTVDLAKQYVSLAGTYLPAYAVNNFFGRLPIIGLALGGGSQGGLFGVTFKAQGPLAGPSLMVNPLSAITPGIFRKIFEFPVN